MGAGRMAHPPKVLGEVVLEPGVATEARRVSFERVPENERAGRWNESTYRFDTARELALSQQYWFREPLDFLDPNSTSAQPVVCSSLYRVRFAVRTLEKYSRGGWDEKLKLLKLYWD